MDETVVALVAHCLDRIEGGEQQALDRICTEHPRLAAEVRARVRLLLDTGLVASASPPTAIGPYRILRELGRGGMGVVYLAHDPALDRDVSLKVAPPLVCLDDRATERFLREARALARLSHPGIVGVHDIGQHAGAPFYVMEYVAGESLAAALQRLRSRGLPAAQLDGGHLWHGREGVDRRSYVAAVAQFAIDVADALAHAHAHGMVHRDVKPGNLMLGPDGRATVLDFGLVRLAAAPTVTASHGLLGTPAYCAPEQLRGEPIDGRADVWSLGVVLFECLTFRTPFAGRTAEQLAHDILLREPRIGGRIERGIPRDLAAICMKALEKEPARRYRTMGDLGADLRAFLDHRPVRAGLPGAAARAWRRIRRRPRSSVAVAAAALTAASLAVFFGLDAAARQRRHAAFVDAQTAAFLAAQADRLFPPLAPRVPAMDAWLARVDEVLARRDELAAMVNHDPAQPAPNLAEPSLGSEQTVVRELLLGLNHLQVLRDQIATRRAHAASVEAVTVTGADAARAWRDAVDAIAASAIYCGLRLRPQLGLLPLGPDPRSGLWEFWHVRSGARPQPGASANEPRFVPTGESGIVFVLLPGGETRVGSQKPSPDAPVGSPFVDPSPTLRPLPVEAIHLAPFFLSKFEVTRGQWRRLHGEQPSFFGAGNGGTLGDDANPLETISWDGATNALAHDGLGLPTAAQWEYAARAGTTTVFCGGDDVAVLERQANVMDAELARDQPQLSGCMTFSDGYAAVAPVGRFLPNPFGLHDVMGNVAEWCADRWPTGGVVRRAGDGLIADDGHSGRWRIVRGGSWATGTYQCGSGYNEPRPNDTATNWIGVRPARALDP